MSLTGSLQLSHELGLCRNQRCKQQLKNVMVRGKLHLLSATLSSRVSFYHQDSWSLYLSGYLNRPVNLRPHRSNYALRRSSFTLAAKAFELPAVKAASVALTRSCNVLQGSPLILKLVPAVGILIFAVWGLAPVVRQTRTLLLNKNDNNWKKSSTYYVMTSYIQPILLWTGALLICRALDPVVLPTEASQIVKQRLLNFVRSLSTVLAFAYCLSSVIQQAQKFFTETSDPSEARNMGFQFAGRAVYSAVWVAAVSLFMELLGFSTQKWLTAGGLGTVLLTLAGREIFTNFLSSIMIHATRPFVLNEWIQTKIEGYEVSGTVEHVGWWSPTIIRGEDREAVHIPNHKFTVNVVRNLSQKTHWRIKTHLAISHLDVNKINNIVADMRKVLAKNPQVEQQKLHRRVFLENINPENQALLILISCFVKTSHFEEYLCVKEAILLDLLRVISHHRARLATPIRTVQKIYSDADLENIPFADSIYNSGGVASKRPLLLIEPPYRINGEEKVKAQNRSSRTGEQDSKTTGRPTPDAKASKSDSKSKETSADDPKADANTGETLQKSEIKDSSASAASISDNKIGEKVIAKSTSKSAPRTDAKIAVAETSPSDHKTQDAVSVNSTQNKSTSDKKQQKIANLGSIGQNASTVSAIGTGIEKAVGVSESSQPKQDGVLESSQPKQAGDRLSRPALEENIVLGVALEGSKRTLPLDEEMDSLPTPADAKELAASRNGNGSLTAEKDKKEGILKATPNDQ